MNSIRLTVKFFIQEPESVHLHDFVQVFHRWIQNKTVAGLLIDVADYRHIHHGPGVILIGDQVDYALDLDGGRPGLLLRRKRLSLAGTTLRQALHEALLQALRACQALEMDNDLQGRISFSTGEVEIAVQDRLYAPNSAESFNAARIDLSPVLEKLYSTSSLEFRRLSVDPREALGFSVHVPDEPGLPTLVHNLETARVAL